MKVVCFAGGVGGAKLADGLAAILPPEALSIIVNTGDDFEYLSLRISPDLDTVCYTLAGLSNPETGWGIRDETWDTFHAVQALGGADWFRLGNKDLATHLIRTTLLKEGRQLSEITRQLCQRWGVQHSVFPMSDDIVETIVHTASGEALNFQEYFVHQACQPVVKSFEYKGALKAQPVPEALTAVKDCDLILLAPSNPWVSIAPIFAVPGYLEEITKKVVVAVSPIVGGKALKGPAAKMYEELGIKPSAAAVAEHYGDILDGFVFDNSDRAELEKIQRCCIISLATDIIMRDKQDRVRLAEEVLEFGESIFKGSQIE